MKIEKLQKLLEDMSLEEKVGQMVQIPGAMMKKGGIITGPTESFELTPNILQMVGSVLGINGAEELRTIQKEYMEKHPHHIPLLFMRDIINGSETIFPIPLAQGCTFSPKTVEECARFAAREATARGLHITFSPMLDLVRDARWGRVMESPGEDSFLNAQMGKAMVRGYQGDTDTVGKGHMGSCIKHFAGYGAPEGGRDYDAVELSERTFREEYLEAYREAVKEGSAMVMTSFNTIDRIPATANEWLMRTVLRDEMGFNGVLISDWGAVDQLINHGVAKDSREAAKFAIRAGVDIDMVSNAYMKYLAELVKSGEVEENLVDEAVMRILKLKNDLGLFENPYKDGTKEAEERMIRCEEHLQCARKAAAESFVLLKNEKALPLSAAAQESLAFIGPYVDEKMLYGGWSYPMHPEKTITIREGASRKKSNIIYAKGTYVLEQGQHTTNGITQNYVQDEVKEMLADAMEAARSADKIVMFLGEHAKQSGEGASKVRIRIPENQMDLLRKIYQINKNIVTVIFSGRPVEVSEIAAMSKAVLMAWMPGSEGGNAIADVLFGEAEPGGRLSMTMPRSVGQVPVYYSRLSTGRPNPEGRTGGGINGYLDETLIPLYPFGYGLTYTDFRYSQVELDRDVMHGEDVITAKVTVQNTGDTVGTETVQLYIQDLIGSVARPVKQLRGFQKVHLNPGESKDVSFTIQEEMLRFYDIHMQYVSEPGEFYAYIGPNSDTENKRMFQLTE